MKQSDNGIFFSIIIPTYNRPELFRRALLSAMNQSFSDYEVVVVNDGSVTGLELYQAIKYEYEWDSKITFIDKQNEGLSAARNTGFLSSKGKFICFLDDDDYYYPNHLKVLYNCISKHKFEEGFYRTYTDFLWTDSKIESQKINENDIPLTVKDSIAKLMNQLVSANNVCLSRSVMVLNKFNTSLKIAEDYEMWLRVLCKYNYHEAPIITTCYDRTRETMSSGTVTNFFKYIFTYDVIFQNDEFVKLMGRDFCKSVYQKYYNWIIDAYQKKKSVDEFVKLRKDIIQRVGFKYYWRKRLSFLR